MIGLVITAAFALQSVDSPVCVDRLEIQTVLDENGKPRFTQAITWRWHESKFIGDYPSGWVVGELEIVKGEPYTHYRDGVHSVRYRTQYGHRNVITRVFKRSFGWVDHEIENKLKYPSLIRVPYFGGNE